MNECYLISSGSYSDYSVDVVVMGSEKLANEIAAALSGASEYDRYNTEKRWVLTEMPEQLPTHVARAQAGKRSEVPNVTTQLSWPWDWAEYAHMNEKLIVGDYTDRKAGYIQFMCRSLDREKAIKVVSDAYYAYIASNPAIIEIPADDEIPF